MSEKITDSTHSDLKFLDYTVDKMNFKYNHDFKEESVEIQMKADSKISYAKPNEEKPNLSQVAVKLSLNVFENPVENNYPFSLYVEVTGYFEINHPDEKFREHLIEKNTLAILFPYVRSLISTITANSNVQSLNLPPLNINKLVNEKKVK